VSKRKLLLSGSSIVELRKECIEFLKETEGMGENIPCQPSPPYSRTATQTREIERTGKKTPSVILHRRRILN
jgi:hypothetical protein